MPQLKPTRFPLFASRAHRIVLTTCVAATSFIATGSSYAQGQAAGANPPVAANAVQNPPPIDPQTVSCTALKARLQAARELPILSGPRGGWGDTFYGSAVPRCQFWQMPVFTYVKTSDGLCGVGYICADKLSFD
jgi:hypothetical protein